MLLQTLTTFLALTRTTNVATRALGAKSFLPALSAKRFSNLGGISEATLADQMAACKSFGDASWSAYWSDIASHHLDLLYDNFDKDEAAREWIEGMAVDNPPSELGHVLRQGAAVITQTPVGTVIDLDALRQGATSELQRSYVVVDAFLKAVVYLSIASWPGKSPNRDEAYLLATRLFDVLLDAIAPTIGLEVQRHRVQSGNEHISLYCLLPSQPSGFLETERLPAVLVSNGLEGTNIESILYFLYNLEHRSHFAWFFMEMPGTYVYKDAMKTGESERIYSDVITVMQLHPSVDRDKLGMLGLSFGGYWATRMAFSDRRLKAVAANGAPLARSFKPWAAFGMPQIMIDALRNASGASNPIDLGIKLQRFAPKRSDLEGIPCHILAFNGDKDTLVATQDTVDLARWAPKSRLQLYQGDDHCAMSHTREWLELCMLFFEKQL